MKKPFEETVKDCSHQISGPVPQCKLYLGHSTGSYSLCTEGVCEGNRWTHKFKTMITGMIQEVESRNGYEIASAVLHEHEINAYKKVIKRLHEMKWWK